MRKSPEAGAFFEVNKQKQETQAEKTKAQESVIPDDFDMNEPEAVEKFHEVETSFTNEAEDAGETIPKLASEMEGNPPQKRAFIDRLPKPARVVVMAVGLAILLGVTSPIAEAGGQYRRSGKKTKTTQPFKPLAWFKEKVAPELSRMQRAEKDIMFGTPKVNPDGSLQYDRKGDIKREKDGVDDELAQKVQGRWHRFTPRGSTPPFKYGSKGFKPRQEKSKKGPAGPPVEQFEISDQEQLFEGWSIQERQVELPDGRTFDYYGPWPEKEISPAELIMYSSGYLNSFDTGRGKNTRAWRPGDTIHPSKMTDRFYRVQGLRPEVSVGYTPSGGYRLSLEELNFWALWEMYRQDPNQAEQLKNSPVAKKIERYHNTAWEEGWGELARKEREKKKAMRDRQKAAEKKKKAKRKAAQKARKDQRQKDKNKSRSHTGIH